MYLPHLIQKIRGLLKTISSLLWMVEFIDKFLGKLSHPYIHIGFDNVDGKIICIIQVEKSPAPVYLKNEGRSEFYARTGNSCQQLDAKESNEWVSTNWSNKLA